MEDQQALKLASSEALWRDYAGADCFPDGSPPLFAEITVEDYAGFHDERALTLSWRAGIDVGEPGGPVVAIIYSDEHDDQPVEMCRDFSGFTKDEVAAWVHRNVPPRTTLKHLRAMGFKE